MTVFRLGCCHESGVCSRIFSRPICFIMASFWTMFHTVLEGTALGMYSQSTRGSELFFLQVVIFCFDFLHMLFLENDGKNSEQCFAINL